MSTLLRGRAFSSAAASGLVAAVLIACGPSQPAPQTQPEGATQGAATGPFIDRLCNTLCTKQVQCDPKWDGATCQKNCRERGSPARAFWRDDYAKATLSCLDAAGCDVMAKGEETEKKCFAETRPEPSETAKHYCEVSQEKERTCSGTAPDMPGCLRAWGMINDAALKDMTACQDQPCGKAVSCAKAVVGFPKPADG